jgi:hypothetical protein
MSCGAVLTAALTAALTTASLAVTLLCATLPAARAADEPAYPAAKCAAFWLGWDDASRHLRRLPQQPENAALAARFRQAAIVTGGPSETLDAYIARERRNMARMITAAIYGDRSSNDIERRLMRTCDDYARANGF